MKASVSLELLGCNVRSLTNSNKKLILKKILYYVS